MTAIASIDSLTAIRVITADVCEEVFAPPPTLTVSQCADDHRMLPPTAAERGRFRTIRIPYMRRIMDVLGDESVRRVVFAKSAQVAGTTIGENFLLYLMLYAPCGILSVWPTVDKLRSWSTKNLRPLIEDTPELAALFPQSGRRSSKDSIASKEFPGGFLQLLTAKSTAALRSTTARVIIAEEIDEWEGDIGNQGDPLEQLRARNRTFWNRKEYDVSTPTVWGASRIWTEWERSTQEHYFVPCPHCNGTQRFRWREGEDDQDESGMYRFVFERDAYGEVVPGSTHFLCEHCGVLIEERWRQPMLEAGDWTPTHPGRATLGFHIWTAYSPLVAWDDLAAAFLRAKDSPATMQGFVNLWLGLPYREKGQQLNAHYLAQRAESYGEGVDVPHGVGVLVAYVDVQGDRLELFVWGFGEHEVGWVIAWEQIEGDPGQGAVWEELDRLLLTSWRHASGAPVTITACAVDAGYHSEAVHRFCDARAHRNVFATVGRGGRGNVLLKEPDAKRKRKRTGVKNRRATHVIYVDVGKDLLHSRLKLTLREDGTAPPGYVHFSDRLESVFYDGLTAERLVTDYVRGRPVRVWRLPEGLRNEPLDGAVGCMGALAKLGKKVIAGLGEAAKRWSEWTPDQASAPAQPRRMRRVRHAGL